MKKRQGIPNLFVSVESRKGGVGKTTAALCMARLLLKRRYAVLVLDLDITGTNAADIAKSPFWVKDLHVIQEVREVDEKPTGECPLNLITLFDQCFMAGKLIPGFSTEGASSGTLRVDFTKVNVLGSQIYKTDRGGNNNMGVTCIERPGILFDDLHTLWLLELVKQISHNFVHAGLNNQSSESTKYAIILDNSPGYVGIAPAIHEWLTDLGPECGKFLTVTSLDTQDLHACDQAINTVHRLFTGKWQTGLLFMDGGNKGDGINVARDQEEFFMRLALPINGSFESIDSLSFYRSLNLASSPQPQGQRFCDNPAEYIAAIINRVPRAIKDGHLVYEYELSSVLTQEHSVLARVLSNDDEKHGWRDRMISYDEYIENQFLLKSLHRRRRHYERRVHQLINVLDKAEDELNIVTNKKGDDTVWFSEMDYQHHEQLWTQLDRANDIMSRARSAIEEAGLGHLARLIHDEWLPGSIITDFRRMLLRFLSESDFPYFEMRPFEIDLHPADLETRESMVEFKKRIRSEMHDSNEWHIDAKDTQTADVFLNVLSELISLSLTSPLWYKQMRKELSGLFAGVISIELKQWAKRGEGKSRRFGIQRFLAQESISQGELREDREMFESLRFFRRHMMEEGEVNFSDFYRACTTAQARLIDFAADTRFLLQIIRFIVDGEMKRDDLFPFVKGIAEDVIVKKTLSHEDAPGKMAEALRSAEYFREFDGILNKILKAWGVIHEQS